jgi:hypothetical protein
MLIPPTNSCQSIELRQARKNQSDRWRRACAIHNANGKTELLQPTLTHDSPVVVAF